MFRSVEKERNFEKKLILAQKDYYLSADVLEKVATDDGYRDKVDLIDRYLAGADGWILDIGSNTCGESEYLATRGHSIICSDINEYALDISRSRAENFNRNLLNYVACDGHKLPFMDQSIHFVTLIESLHHMVDPQATLKEAKRVLAPGGKLFLYEPYAYNPYRRIAEVRDYFKGTIEKSFGIGQLEAMLASAGLKPARVERHVSIPSTKKMQRVSAFRRFLKQSYYKVSAMLPGIFGMVAMLAEREGKLVSTAKPPFESILRCPISGAALIRKGSELEARVDSHITYVYPTLNHIPVLIEFNAKKVTTLPE